MEKLVKFWIFLNAKIDSKYPKKKLKQLFDEYSILIIILFNFTIFFEYFQYTSKLCQKHMGSSVLLPHNMAKGTHQYLFFGGSSLLGSDFQNQQKIWTYPPPPNAILSPNQSFQLHNRWLVYAFDAQNPPSMQRRLKLAKYNTSLNMDHYYFTKKNIKSHRVHMR